MNCIIITAMAHIMVAGVDQGTGADYQRQYTAVETKITAPKPVTALDCKTNPQFEACKNG